MTRALVIGQGSIGKRHARILDEMACPVAVVSRFNGPFPTYSNVATAMAANAFDYVVVATDTSQHSSSLTELSEIGFDGTVLVEKPLFDREQVLPNHSFSRIAVGYNLRFHPVLTTLRGLLANKRILAVNIYVGQYLADWRPGTDYRETSSVSRSRGGGVLRDLSHEIDYARWLFGPWVRLTASGGRLGSLTVDSDDYLSVLAELETGASLNITMSYFDRIVRREIIVNCDDATVHVDLVKGTLRFNDAIEAFEVARDETYTRQHKAALSPEKSDICTIEEGLEVMRLIELIEAAASSKVWRLA